MRKETMGIGLAMGLLLGGMSMSASTVTAGERLSTESPIGQLQLTKERIKRLFAGKKFYYIDWHLKDHPIIGVAEFDGSMQEMKYREIIGGKKHGSVDLVLRKDGFSVLWPTKRYVKVRKIRKGFIETNSKKLFRFYKSKQAAQAYLTRLGYDVLPPKIELLGENPLKIEQYHSFIDPGVNAVDTVDGEVAVRSRGQVDSDTLGTYVITYRAKDLNGNQAVKRRKVEVVPTDDQIWHVGNVAEFRRALEEAAFNGIGDIVMLDRGVYHVDADGQGTFKYNDDEESNLTIRCEPGLTHQDVVLDGNGSVEVLNLNNAQPGVKYDLHGLSIVNGHSDGSGAGIYANHSAILTDCNISDNVSLHGSGGGALIKGDAQISNSSFEGNYAKGSVHPGGYGGGLFVLGHLKLLDSALTDNHEKNNGGGFYAGSVEMDRCRILNNSAYTFSGKGGGFYTSRAVIRNSLIAGNRAAGPDGRGGGFYAGKAEIINSVLKNNYAHYKGGGFYARSVELKHSTVLENNSTNRGAGFFSTYARVDRTKIVRNNAVGSKSLGGAFYAYVGCFVTNSLIMKNNANGAGDSLLCQNYAYVVNNTFVKNDGSAYAGIVDPASYGEKTFSIFVNNVFDNEEDSNALVLKGIAYVANNYIDYTKIREKGTVYKRGNLLPSIVGELRFKRGYIPTASSPTVDRGLSLEDPFFLRMVENNETMSYLKKALKVDLSGKVRQGAIDVGAVEYRSKKK